MDAAVSLLSPEEIASDRAMAEANLTDWILVERAKVGRGVFDESTGQYANDDPDAPKDPIYEGPAKIQIRADINANIVEPLEVEREWGYQTSTLKTPIVGAGDSTGSAVDIRPDDICTVVTAPYDPALVGRVFNIHTADHKSLASTRRFKLREAVR